MKFKIFLIFMIIFTFNVSFITGYPQIETTNIMKEVQSDFEGEIIQVQEDGDIIIRNTSSNNIYYSKYKILSSAEMEILWQQIQEKRALEAQNQTEKLTSKQDLQTKYRNQIDNLNTVVNNSNYIQAKTNWTNADIVPYMKVLAWNDEVQAKGQIAILKILRWMLW